MIDELNYYSDKDKSALAWRPRFSSTRAPFSTGFVPYVSIKGQLTETGLWIELDELCRRTSAKHKSKKFLFLKWKETEYFFVETEEEFRKRIYNICSTHFANNTFQKVKAVYSYSYDAGYDSWHIADHLVWENGKWR